MYIHDLPLLLMSNFSLFVIFYFQGWQAKGNTLTLKQKHLLQSVLG